MVKLQLKPGEGTHPIGNSEQGSGVVPLCPKSGMVEDAPSGRRMPSRIIPTMVKTFTLVNQNSISPYLRTLKKLNKIGQRRKRDVHTTLGMSLSGTQKVMKFSIEAASLGTFSVQLIRTVRKNQFQWKVLPKPVCPAAGKSLDISRPMRTNDTIAGLSVLLARVNVAPGIGRNEIISPSEI